MVCSAFVREGQLLVKALRDQALSPRLRLFACELEVRGESRLQDVIRRDSDAHFNPLPDRLVNAAGEHLAGARVLHPPAELDETRGPRVRAALRWAIPGVRVGHS